jgi:hypothetical protein
MIGKSTIVWIVTICAASGILYQTSYKAQEQERELARLNRTIQQERDAIQVLKAEWASLNDPTTLDRLAREHLVLAPTTAQQIAVLTDIPEKQPDTPSQHLTPIPGRKPGAPKPPPAAVPSHEPAIAARTDTPVVMVNYGVAR